MEQIIGYLILCPLAFVMGFVVCHDLIARQEKRELPLREAVARYQIDEAYRAGQQNPLPALCADAPAPALMDQICDTAPYSRRCSLEPLFPDPESAQDELQERHRIKRKRIAGIWYKG